MKSTVEKYKLEVQKLSNTNEELSDLNTNLSDLIQNKNNEVNSLSDTLKDATQKFNELEKANETKSILIEEKSSVIADLEAGQIST